MRKRLYWAIGLLLLLATLSQFRLVRVSDGDMAPGFRPGDWVLLGPGRADPGEVVHLQDPSDPARGIFRRIVGEAGDQILYKSGNLALNSRGLRIREMNREDNWVIRSEADAWLLRKRAGRDLSPHVEHLVEEDTVYLMADARDEAIDSRWWGAVPRSKLGKKVWLRWGEPDVWRKRLSVGGQDGPWPVPPPKSPGPDAIQTGAF